MTTTLLLIRHGETAWNAVRRLQGHLDIELNDAGRRQAAALAHALADAPLDAIVSSDLQRAMQTAGAVARLHDVPLHTDPALRERGYGVFEGLLYSEIEARYPDDFHAWQQRHVDAVMPHGERHAESFRQFYDRGVGAIGRWAERYAGRTLALVAHGGVLECAYRAATGMTLESPRDFQVRNASINRFTYANGKLALTQWGDVEHLSLSLDDIV
ncbi:histidine phosphatase family protein [Pseudoduganella armeniaca]|uniref:Histidine phosphatase family protein n=1 Tax=Pseudoduganella armeniaca TaxID=2072590 RepID=A0A2R4C7B2_9BURK|nr:histidine phosphatase family protein [Pseudoduganella armeniaca]AVR95422.1 histidine phosphatase family protein [Pseudoduganella armeniaca]